MSSDWKHQLRRVITQRAVTLRKMYLLINSCFFLLHVSVWENLLQLHGPATKSDWLQSLPLLLQARLVLVSVTLMSHHNCLQISLDSVGGGWSKESGCNMKTYRLFSALFSVAGSHLL